MARYIPENILILRRQVTSDIIQGLIVPDCGDAAKFSEHIKSGRSKMQTYYHNSNLPDLTSDNKPKSGYSVVDVNSKYSSSDVYWGVLSPDGYRIDISSKNFNHLLENTDIHKTVIQEELVWIRIDQTNFLTTTETDEYKTAISVKQLNTSIPFTDVKVGNKFSTKNYKNLIFCGSVNYISKHDLFNTYAKKASQKRYVFEFVEDGAVFTRATPFKDVFEIDNTIHPFNCDETKKLTSSNDSMITSPNTFSSSSIDIEVKPCTTMDPNKGSYDYIIRYNTDRLAYVNSHKTSKNGTTIHYFEANGISKLTDKNGVAIPSMFHQRNTSSIHLSSIDELYEVTFSVRQKGAK